MTLPIPKITELALTEKIMQQIGVPKHPVDLKISASCQQKIAELEQLNKKILPKKIRENRLNLVALASFISLVVGGILMKLGISLSLSGIALPVGIALIAGGAVSIFASGIFLRIYLQKRNQLEKVKINEQKILILKKLIEDPNLRIYTDNLKEELGLSHLSTAEIAISCNVKRLYELHHLSIAEKLKTPRKRDPSQLICWDYTARFNFLFEKIAIANQFMKSLDEEITVIKKQLQKNRDPKLIYQEKILLLRAEHLKHARQLILKRAPAIEKLSYRAYYRYESLKKLSNRRFLNI